MVNPLFELGEAKATVDEVLHGLMRRYIDRVPDVKRIVDAMIKKEVVSRLADIENDHVAFRTMGVPQLGIQSLEKIFLRYGYQKRDHFSFEGKKLDAYWYSPPQDNLPRVFISELRVGDLSKKAQTIIHGYTNDVSADPVDALDLDDGSQVDQFLHSPLWRTPTWADYQTLSDESEYAAWVIYNRYYLNHFTITVHNLPEGYNTISEFNVFLESIGIKLNSAGGKIKTSADGGLIQSSTVAQIVDAEFADGDMHRISGSYVEFAERRPLKAFEDIPANQLTRAQRRDGFEVGNADKIFESTFRTQTEKE